MPENLSSSQEFQQRKLSSIKRTVRTASCQHVLFFPLSRICSFAYLHLHAAAAAQNCRKQRKLI